MKLTTSGGSVGPISWIFLYSGPLFVNTCASLVIRAYEGKGCSKWILLTVPDGVTIRIYSPSKEMCQPLTVRSIFFGSCSAECNIPI